MKKAKLIEFLMGLGLTKAVAERLAKNTPDDGEEIPQTDIDLIMTEFREGQRTIIENDTEFITKIQAAEKGKQLDIITRKLKSVFNLDASVTKDKNIEQIIQIAKDEISKLSTKDVQTLQDEIIGLNNKIKEYEETIIPGTKAEVEKQKKDFLKTNKLLTMLTDETKYKLRVPVETTLPILNTKIDPLYDVDIDEKGAWIVYNKGTKIQPLKADKSGVLSYEDILKGVLEENKLIEKSNGTPTPAKKDITPDDPDHKPVVSDTMQANIDAAKENLKQVQELKKTA